MNNTAKGNTTLMLNKLLLLKAYYDSIIASVLSAKLRIKCGEMSSYSKHIYIIIIAKVMFTTKLYLTNKANLGFLLK